MAQNNLENTSKVDTNITAKASLVTDLNSSYVGNESYSHARNAVRSSKDGDLGTIGNEPSNILCINAPYKIIGHIPLPDDTFMIFSTNNTDSEIGVGNPSTCTYTKLLNDPCLNFKDTNQPITGVAKKDFQKGVVVTFTDKANPFRRAELNTFSSSVCDDILLFKKIDQPCITAVRGQVGNIPNGMYSVVVAYVVDNQVFSDWYSITNRIPLFSLTNANSIEIKVDGLDTEFKEFALAVVGTFIEPNTGAVTKLAKQIGVYSTKVHSISVSDFLNPNYTPIPLEQLVIKKRTWQKGGIISSNSSTLILGDLVARDEENYQLKALSIEMEYVVTQVPADYYEVDGQDVGFYRDENYDFYINPVYNTGEEGDKFHMAGRVAKPSDLTIVSSSDVYEYDKQFSDCTPSGTKKRWQIENTAGKMVPSNQDFFCDRRELGTGEMGYHESTELYPDNPATYGEWANTPIRFPKMPDECKVPRYSVIDGKYYVNIIGIRFKNIQPFDSEDVVGYRITRSDRKGGNGTVVARGIMTNLRSYQDQSFNQTVYYSNYPVNDLAPDQYLSSTQTVFKNNKENNFTPLTDFHNDKFSFYSPHTQFEPRYTLGTELKIESEEVATITGQFELVHNHPRQKLLNQFSFWVASAVGFIEAALILIGKRTEQANKQAKISAEGVSSGTSDTWEFGRTYPINTVADLVGLDLVGYISDKILARKFDISTITAILTVLASLAIKIPYSIFGGIKAAEDLFNVIYNFTGFTDYVYQYNSQAFFNKSICVGEGNKRRRLKTKATYIPSTVVNVEDKTFNNLFREKMVYLELNKEIAKPLTTDNSRQTATGFNLCDDITKKVTSTGSAFYVTSKVVNPNQYGQVGSAAPVSMHSCVLSGTETPVLYGGDCVIARSSFQKRMQFFSQNIADTNFQDGTEYDYRKYRNIGFPRFWIDSTKFDFSELLSGNTINFARFSRTTTSKHNLDCKKGDKKNIARIDDAYMYLSNNCAIEYFVEADYNPAFREVTKEPYFSKNNQNISDIFRSDRLDTPEEFIISRAYSDLYTTETFKQQQRDNFDPSNPIPTTQPNAVIYSLPSFNLQNIDNWQYFLPANYFSFSEVDYGKLTGIHQIDQDRLIFLFSRASPFITMGRSLLQLNNQVVTIGDGGLFAQDPRELMPTDNNYASCTSRFAFSNTHLGRFYPSSVQGRIISYTNNLDDVTREGMSYWCKNYMPIFLYKYFPTYPQDVENTVTGVGYLTVFDSFNETIYVTKRDFTPKREYASDITYHDGSFYYKSTPILLRSQFFNDVSWTLSYCPVDKAFVSWHDWHPDLIIQRDNHFLTIKDKGIWKHNEAFDSYCNFYGKDFPFEIEPISSSGQQIHTIRSIEYFLEVYHYKNFGRDRFHVHHENFSHLIVSNSEQISPLLKLNYRTSNPENDLSFPKRNSTNSVTWDILFSKEENKYRVSQFWDAVKDRGEFSNSEVHLFPTDESGYKQVINPVAIDINKPEEQRKKFRHYFNKFRLIKDINGQNKFIVKLLNVKKLLSPR